MKIIKIPKKTKGEYRTIYSLSGSESYKYQEYLSELEECFFAQEKIILGATKNIIVHGFIPKRSIITNSICHKGYDYTVNFDLTDFFDSVKPNMVKQLISDDLINKCFIDLAPRQGLPTSPLVANIAALKLDRAILRFIKKHKLDIVYTRYADDLSFSYKESENEKFLVDHSEKTIFEFLKNNIPNIISKVGFKSNKKKIHFQSSKYGRRNITGIKVDSEIHVGRKTKRKIRAARFQKNEDSLNGLLEFSKLKIPTSSKKIIQQKKQIDILKQYLSRKKKNIKYILKTYELEDFELDQKFYKFNDKKYIITNDVLYKINMSNLGDGWTSCYSSSGCNSNAPIFLSFIKGVYICGEVSEKTRRFGRLNRHILKNRAIVYLLDNGEYIFNSRFYGNNTSDLQEFLISKNIKSSKSSSGIGVVGYAPMIEKKSSMYGGIKKKKIKVSICGKENYYYKLYT